MLSSTMLRRSAAALVVAGAALSGGHGALAQSPSIDNSALNSASFRDHQRTFGLVFTLPADVTEVLDATITGPLREKLINAGLRTEAQMYNIPHVTVVHIHNADPATPETHAQGAAEAARAARDYTEEILHHRSGEGRRRSVVARPRHRQGGCGLRNR